MEWSIQEVARGTGTTSRTLRHYDAIGLLRPSRLLAGGQRAYDGAALVRLQRILLLRGMGVGLARIARVLEDSDEAAVADALAEHVVALRHEQERLSRQIAAVEDTIEKLKGGGEMEMDTMFDGFDHTVYRDEVESRWGAEAYRRGDEWWRSMSAADKAAWQARAADLARDWADAAERGVDTDSGEARALAQRHVEWLGSIPGTPRGEALAEYVRGLGDMYVADPRFAANYATADGGSAGAEFVRDALRHFMSPA
jgi:DNA-binding transcriptional MerR regulator